MISVQGFTIAGMISPKKRITIRSLQDFLEVQIFHNDSFLYGRHILHTYDKQEPNFILL